MAKVIISHYSPIRVGGVFQSLVFYDGLIKALIDNGNDVLQIITNDFVKTAWNGTNRLRKTFSKRSLFAAIQDFGPDILISFNNSKLEDIENFLDIPIILWDADYFEYFNDKEKVKQDKDRYYFFSFSNGSCNDIRERVSPGANRLHLVKPATALTARAAEFRDNISFIGTFFGVSRRLVEAYEKDPDGVKILIKTVIERGGPAQGETNTRLDGQTAGYELTDGLIKFLTSAEWRSNVIAAVAPLGLRIFGPKDWYNIASFSLDAFLSYDPRLAYSLVHNEDIYNRSRIAINITHKQNMSAYPWRVPDIMATNACLVSDYSRELNEDFGATVPLQTYDSPADAHDVCKRLLADEAMRAEVVAASRAAIRDGFTWDHRLRDISQILGVPLHEPRASPGRHEILKPEPFLKPTSRIVVAGKRAFVDGLEALLDSGGPGALRLPLSAKKKRRVRQLFNMETPQQVYELQP